MISTELREIMVSWRCARTLGSHYNTLKLIKRVGKCLRKGGSRVREKCFREPFLPDPSGPLAELLVLQI